MKKKFKLLPIVVAFMTTSGGFHYSLNKGKSVTNGAVKVEESYSEGVMDTFNVTSTTTTSTSVTTTSTTSTSTSTTSTSTSTTVCTTESIYKDIMFLYGIDDSYSLEDIDYLVSKYSGYCNLPYDTCVSILNDNIDSVLNYNSFEEGIMRTLFEISSDMGLLSSYCTDGNKVVKEMDRDSKESIMIDMCNVMGISDDDKKIILAIFRWETGHGMSSLCAYSNNYGGIRVYNGEFGIYQTPEYGMYRAIECMYGHICRAHDDGCYDIYSVVNNMSYSYCPYTAGDWANSINDMIYSVDDYYDFDSGYVKKYEG